MALLIHLCDDPSSLSQGFIRDALAGWRLQGVEVEPYGWLVAQLSEADAPSREERSWRTQIMDFINTLCNAPQDIEYRWYLRWQFGQVRIEEAIAVRHNRLTPRSVADFEQVNLATGRDPQFLYEASRWNAASRKDSNAMRQSMSFTTETALEVAAGALIETAAEDREVSLVVEDILARFGTFLRTGLAE